MTYVMMAKQFVDKAVHIANDLDTEYKLGTFGAYVGNSKWRFDCSGLVKGILWGFCDQASGYGGAVYGSNGVPDHNALQIKAACSDVSSDFSALLPGEFLYKQTGTGTTQQHCGIYIGHGLAVEATPAWDDGVQVSSVQNINPNGLRPRQWQFHGKLPWINYSGFYLDDGILFYLDSNYTKATLQSLNINVHFNEITGAMDLLEI